MKRVSVIALVVTLFLAFMVLLLVRPGEAFKVHGAASTGWLKQYDFDWLTIPAWVADVNNAPAASPGLTQLIFTTDQPMLMAIQSALPRADGKLQRMVLTDAAMKLPTKQPFMKAVPTGATSYAATLDELWAIQKKSATSNLLTIRSAREEGEYLDTNTEANCKDIKTEVTASGIEGWVIEPAPGNKWYIRTTNTCQPGGKGYLAVTGTNNDLTTVTQSWIDNDGNANKLNARWDIMKVMKKRGST